MDFKRLFSFVRIAELGSLSRVADRMRIGQPALSRQLRLLEEELGVELFARHRRGMVLTEEGEELRSRVAGPLREIMQAVEDVRSLSQQLGGHIAFGLTPTIGNILAGPLTRRMATETPNVSLRIVEGYDAHLIDWLHRREIDAALLYGPASDYQMTAEELLVEDLLLVGSSDSTLDPNTPVPVSSLADLPLVLPSHPNRLRVLVDNAAAKAGVRFNIRFQADSFSLMKNLVSAGLGYTVLPLSALNQSAVGGHLKYAPLKSPRVTRQLVFATLPGRTPSRASRVLRQTVRREISRLVIDGSWPAHLMFDLKDDGNS